MALIYSVRIILDNKTDQDGNVNQYTISGGSFTTDPNMDAANSSVTVQARSDDKDKISGSFQVIFGGSGIFLVSFTYSASQAVVTVSPATVESNGKTVRGRAKYSTGGNVMSSTVTFDYPD